eukprot:1893814-Pyramimonas_sp.AAC.1
MPRAVWLRIPRICGRALFCGRVRGRPPPVAGTPSRGDRRWSGGFPPSGSWTAPPVAGAPSRGDRR